MSITAFDVLSDEKIEGGVWLQPNHPVGGEPMFANDDKSRPMRIRIRSNASRAIKDYEEAKRRTNLNGVMKGKGSANKTAAAAAKDDSATRAALLTSGLENVEGPGITAPSQAELEAMYSRPGVSWLTAWVLEQANDDSNYGDEPLGEGAAPSI